MTSARDLTADVILASQQSHVPYFPMIVFEFDSGTVYLAGLDYNVDFDGETWLGASRIGTIEKTVETADSVEGLRFTLSGVSDEAVAEAQQEEYQGRAVTVLWAFINEADQLCVDANAWQGRLDQPTIAFGKTTASISITAENRMADWQRPRKLMFNHADQLRVDETDNFFLGSEAMENAPIVLFSKESQMV
ncbi:MAG: hypothetical protein V4718_00525 [Pseudomonadota bacterium]